MAAMICAGEAFMRRSCTARSRPAALLAACAATAPRPGAEPYTPSTRFGPTHDVTAPPTLRVARSVATIEYVAEAVAGASTPTAPVRSPTIRKFDIASCFPG